MAPTALSSPATRTSPPPPLSSSSLGGYLGLVWGREPADFKNTCVNRRLERVWLPSPSLGGAAAGFQGIFYDYGYQTPGEVSRCDYGANDTTCDAALAAKDAPAFMADLIGRTAALRGDDIMIMFGAPLLMHS